MPYRWPEVSRGKVYISVAELSNAVNSSETRDFFRIPEVSERPMRSADISYAAFFSSGDAARHGPPLDTRRTLGDPHPRHTTAAAILFALRRP